MEISFNNKLLNSQEVRAINIELILFESQKRPSIEVMGNEKKMFEGLFDFVASKGQRGTVLALLRLMPELQKNVPELFEGHIKSGNLVNFENYLLCFPELRDMAGEFAKTAARMSRANPQSTDRKIMAEALKGLKRESPTSQKNVE